MKKLLSSMLLCSLLFAACRKIPPVDLPAQRDFQTRPFHSVSIRNVHTCFVQPGPFLVRAQGYKDSLQNLSVTVLNDTLFIEPRYGSTGTMALMIQLPRLRQFSVAGTGATTVQGFNQQDTISGYVRQQHRLEINASATGIFLYALDRARVRMSGEARTFRSLAADSSIIEAYPLQSYYSRPVANNASQIYTTVAGELSASAIMNSRVYYRGNPRTLMTSELDGGQIIQQ